MMTSSRSLLFPLAVACAFIAHSASASTSASSSPPPPLWGALEPGAHAVGFREILLHDPSRPWRSTRPYGRAFAPDLVGRPIQVDLWYPAVADSGAHMRYGDYLARAAPSGFEDLSREMARRKRAGLGSLKPETVAALLKTEMAARSAARPRPGRYPVVVLLGGLGAGIDDNVVMAEYLASHGYVVASVSQLGETAENIAQSRSRDAVETNVRDVEFATPAICSSSNADCARLAVAGHSIGGVIAVLYANRNPNVAAAVAFDGTYGFLGEGRVLTEAVGYAAERMRASLLDLRRAAGEQSAQLDLAPATAYRHADRSWVTLPHMHHSDFTAFAMIADRFGVPIKADYAGTGWDRAAGRKGYESAAHIALAFLSDKLATPSSNLATTAAATAEAGGTYAHADAEPVPLTASEVAAFARDFGMPATRAAFEAACAGVDMRACMDQDAFNAAGYAALSANDVPGAIALFEVVAWAFPKSANAQDSLADGYARAGRAADEKAAAQRALSLAGADPTLDPSTRQTIIDTETRRLSELDRRRP